MSSNAKYCVVKQMKAKPHTVVEVQFYEVRQDARDEADAKNKSAVSYKFKVMPLKPGKIKRAAGVLKDLLKDIGTPIKTPSSK